MPVEAPVDQPPRPRVVAVAALLWWASLIPSVVVLIVRTVSELLAGELVVGVVGFVVVFGCCFLLAWLVLRMARGSGRARFWLAVLAAFGVVGIVIALFTGNVTIRVLEPLAGAVGSALTYLPVARPFFPKAPPRVRRPSEPAIVGWDPDTGEPVRATE